MTSWPIVLASYVLAATFAEWHVHAIVYPVVGYGHPLVGWRRWALCAASPVIVPCLPLIAIGILVVSMFEETSTGPGHRTGRR